MRVGIRKKVGVGHSEREGVGIMSGCTHCLYTTVNCGTGTLPTSSF